MNCPLCKLEGRITATRYVVENDNNDEETKLYAEQDIKCVNKNCENFEKVFETIKIPMKIG